MKRFLFAILLIVAVSGIIVAQKTTTDASSRISAAKQGSQIIGLRRAAVRDRLD